MLWRNLFLCILFGFPVKGFKDVMVAMVVGQKSLFLPEFFEKIYQQDYPKEHIFLHVTVQNVTKYEYVRSIVAAWKKEYRKIKLLPSKRDAKAKQEAVHYAKNFKVESILFLSSVAHLENPETLKSLMNQDIQVVAPFLQTYEKFSHARRICDIGMGSILNDSSSFPDLVTQKGLRSENYQNILIGTNFATDDVLSARNATIFNESAYWIDIPRAKAELASLSEFTEITSRKKCCLVPVKSVQHAYLVKTNSFPERDYRNFFENRSLDEVNVDAFFTAKLAELGIPVMLLNDATYGQLVNLRNIQEDKLHPELTRIMENHDLWETRYITERVRKTASKHPDIMPEILPQNTTKKGICEDTFNMEMFTEKFAEQMIEEAELVDNWFESGNNAVYDIRNKRKENVPTTDINLWQYGLEDTWMAFINFYLYPRKCIFFPGHPGLDTGGHFFTVRYRWEEQPALKPHYDNSLYTLNVALNQIGEDFEGGGTYFLHQKCADLTMATGEILAHPGRVTHYHEGLPTTSGTRYIMISFVNAAFSCYERNGVPTCPGFFRKPDFEEEIRKVDTIARINEAVPQWLDLEVDGKSYTVSENWEE